MRINPAMAKCLLEDNTFRTEYSCSLIFLGYDVDFESVKADLYDGDKPMITESILRSWMIANLGEDYSICEFMTKKVPISYIEDVYTLVRTFDLAADVEQMDYVRDGLIKSFVLVVKEDNSGTYNSTSPTSDILFGTVGKIGDEVEKDLMLRETQFTSEIELVKNEIKVSIEC